MLTKGKLLLVLCLSILIFSGHAQDPEFQRFTKEDGLPGNFVRCFLKDNQGFMWIGTSSGLCKYDGLEFKLYTKKSGFGISNDYISCLFQDSEGLIWIGTNNGGINVFDPKTESLSIYQHDKNDPNSIPGDRVGVITEDQNGVIWVGFDNGIGLSKIDKKTGTVTNYDPFASISRKGAKAIRTIIVDQWRPDTLWIATTSGLISFDKTNESFYVIDHPLKSVNRHGFFDADQIDKDHILGGLFHAGTDIYNINEDAWQGNFEDLEKEVRIMDVVRKSETEYWLAVRKKGLALLDLKTNNIQFVPSDLKNYETVFPGFTYAVFSDENKLWVGGINGLSFYNGIQPTFPFDSLSFTQELYGRVSSASAKYDKNYLAGTYGAGLWEIDKLTNEKKIHAFDNASSEIITDMLEMSDKILLVGHSGLKLFNKRTGQVRSLEIGPFMDLEFFMESIHPWTDEFALILTRHGGAFKIHLETFDISPLFEINEKVIPYNHDVFQTKDGKLWIATDKDILIYDPQNDSISHFSPTSMSSQGNKHILTIKEDRHGTKWIGTLTGLIKLEDGKETLINSSNSNLPSDYIQSILFDKNHDLWVATDVGISRIDHETLETINYDNSDGVNYSGAFERVDDQILVGSYGGYSLFHPDSIDFKYDPPKVYFTAFNVANEKYQSEKAINYSEQINLNYNQNFISFGFSAPSFIQPNKLQFAYKLEGLDSDWIYSGNRRYANYTNLDGGEYSFAVKARYADGDWGEIKTIPINVSSPFWETWWFYTLCCLAIVGAGFSFYKTRINILQRKADQEAQELRLEAFQKRLMDLNASPPDLALNMDEVNSKLSTPLSEREFEVLQMSLDGKSNAEIAEGLFISMSTVKFHLRNTYSKLGVSNRKEALIYVVKKP
ncbi:ligand-binding sensor domain-containing protein [Ekhidna sp.]